jgi:hypothetical protein
MQSTETMQMPALGEAGEPCASCGTPLAADQRYCLNCGQRRVGPRVEYRRYLAPEGDGPAPAPLEAPPAPSAPEPSRTERDFAPLAAVGGIAILGLMLLAGVLIGKGNNAATTAPAPVIKVGELEGGTTAKAESGKSEAPSKATSAKGKKEGTGAKTVEGGLTGDAARKSSTVQASKGDLEALNNTSGEGYQDAVKKLPDKIATPGAPPPVDKSKAPGAGGKAETFE